jgi:hypothetical protein
MAVQEDYDKSNAKVTVKSFQTKWVEYHLPNGTEFWVAVCGYSGKIRYLVMGKDELFHRFMKTTCTSTIAETERCEAGGYCLDPTCRFNTTTREHLCNIFGMSADELIQDSATSEKWESESVIESFVKLVEGVNYILPKDLNADEAETETK